MGESRRTLGYTANYNRSVSYKGSNPSSAAPEAKTDFLNNFYKRARARLTGLAHSKSASSTSRLVTNYGAKRYL